MTDSSVSQEPSDNTESSHKVLDMLLSIVDEENAHGYALLLLWASQSNAIPVCHTLSNWILLIHGYFVKFD